MAAGGSIEEWAKAVRSRQVKFIFHTAPTCKCGCGEKLFPTNVAAAVRGTRAPVFKYDSLPCHGRLVLPFNYQFTPEQRQLIIASCLGDGALLKATPASSHRLLWNMGDKAHAEFKSRAFSFLSATLVEKKNPGWGSEWFSVGTSCHPSLDQFREEFYSPDRKPIAKPEVLAELNEVGWAWWYGDDGSLMRQKGCADMALLHTEGYSEACNIEIQRALTSFIGIADGVSLAKYNGGNPKKERIMLRIKTNATVEFFKKIAPHMAPSMAYKLGDFQIT